MYWHGIALLLGSSSDICDKLNLRRILRSLCTFDVILEGWGTLELDWKAVLPDKWTQATAGSQFAIG